MKQFIFCLFLGCICIGACKKNKVTPTENNTTDTTSIPPQDSTKGTDTTHSSPSTIITWYTGDVTYSYYHPGLPNPKDTTYPGYGKVTWRYKDSTIIIESSVTSDYFKMNTGNHYSKSSGYSGTEYSVTDTSLYVIYHTQGSNNGYTTSFYGKKQ